METATATGAATRNARPAVAPMSRRFVVVLGLIAFLALAGRVVYVVAVTQGDHQLYDATYYELQARSIADGGGFFRDPFFQLRDPPIDQPAADHPPVTVLALIPAALVDDRPASEFLMRLTMVLVGTGVVIGIGLLGRSLAGETVGLVSAGIAALSPNLFMNDGLIMSESLSVLFTVAIVGLSYRVMQRGTTWPRAAVLGLLSGVAVLTRAELAGLVPLLVLPALWVGSRDSRGRDDTPDDGRPARRIGHLVGLVLIALATTCVVVMPWVGFNLSRFERPTTISTNDGLALRGSNCDQTYYGHDIGFASVFPPCVPWRDTKEQSVFSEENRSFALSYIRHHLRRLPVVVVARLGRGWSMFKLGQNASIAAKEGRPVWGTYLGVVATWIAIPLSIAGGVVLHRRRVRVWPLVVPVVISVATIAFITGGLVRYRAPAEPTLVVLSAVALVALFGRRHRDEPATTDDPDGPARTDEPVAAGSPA